MMPSGQPNPAGGCQTASPSLLRSNSAIMGSQGRHMQVNLSSLGSPRPSYNSSMLANPSNVNSLLQRTFGNIVPSPGHSGQGGFQYGNERPLPSDPLSMLGNEMNFTSANLANRGESGQLQNRYMESFSGDHMLQDNRQFQSDQIQMQNYNLSQQQQQYQSVQGGFSGLKRVKLEPQVANNQNGVEKQMQSFHNLAPVKLEQQQSQIGRVVGPVKLEIPHADQPVSFHQPQQRQQNQILQLPNQTSQSAIAEMSVLQQQRMMHIHQQQHQQMQQQQQQRQLLKALPHQRNHLPQQFQHQNLIGRSVARPVYEPGTCAQRLTHYMYQQRQRPADNSIEFWRNFVTEFFAPNAKKRWCVSLYGNSRQTNGVFPQEVWQCEICNTRPGRGFETTIEVLPRLFKIKYDSGTLEELLYLDMPREYMNASGQIVLDYAKVVQETVFEQLRVVRDGHLRVIFSPNLKICCWEFCARRHEELIPRRSIIPQVTHLGAAALKYQAASQNASSSKSSTEELKNNCTMFASSARQLAKALEMPLVNELGYTKRYVRCLQISEVVNSMKDLIDFSRERKMGAIESLANFPSQSNGSSAVSGVTHPEDQHQVIRGQRTVGDHLVQQNAIQTPGSSGLISINNPRGTNTSTSSAVTDVDQVRQNSLSSRHDGDPQNPNSPYGVTAPVQIHSAESSNSLLAAQPNPSSPFSSSTPSSSNNPPHTSQVAVATSKHISSTNSPALQQSSQSSDPDPNESQSAVDKIIQDLMSSSQIGGAGDTVSPGPVGNNNMNKSEGMAQISNKSRGRGNGKVGNEGVNNMNNSGSGNMGGGGSIGMPTSSQDNLDDDLSSGLLDGLGILNGFDDLQFDWKTSL